MGRHLPAAIRGAVCVPASARAGSRQSAAGLFAVQLMYLVASFPMGCADVVAAAATAPPSLCRGMVDLAAVPSRPKVLSSHSGLCFSCWLAVVLVSGR